MAKKRASTELEKVIAQEVIAQMGRCRGEDALRRAIERVLGKFLRVRRNASQAVGEEPPRVVVVLTGEGGIIKLKARVQDGRGVATRVATPAEVIVMGAWKRERGR